MCSEIEIKSQVLYYCEIRGFTINQKNIVDGQQLEENRWTLFHYESLLSLVTPLSNSALQAEHFMPDICF